MKQGKVDFSRKRKSGFRGFRNKWQRKEPVIVLRPVREWARKTTTMGARSKAMFDYLGTLPIRAMTMREIEVQVYSAQMLGELRSFKWRA
ncbi:MAG: hypothetical protein LBG66_03180 [Gallionellaceae bacterium]|jgi:hypothetical protein|nr:hypothetical protein [Gallionellaceae bacterium]